METRYTWMSLRARRTAQAVGGFDLSPGSFIRFRGSEVPIRASRLIIAS